jgi:hypothetical protein
VTGGERIPRSLRAAAAVSVGVAVVAVIALGGYALLHQPIGRALDDLSPPDPIATLHHDRAFMTVPPGARLAYDQGWCDSGQLAYTRRLDTAAPDPTRRAYEATLQRGGWTPAPRVDHEFGHRMRGGHVLVVDVATHTSTVEVFASLDLNQPGLGC